MKKWGYSRRQFLGGAAIAALGHGVGFGRVFARGQTSRPDAATDMLLVNGRIHTMDAANRIVSQVLLRNGRFAAVGNSVPSPGRGVRRIDLKGKTVVPGIIDAHNHIVLVGNRPGWHTPLEHVFTIPDAIAALKTRAAGVPRGEFITTVGPVAAMQFPDRRLPNLTELDAVDRPVYIQAAQGGARTNTLGKMWLESKGVTVATDGAIAGPALNLALKTLRQELLTPETRKRGAHDALQYYAALGITTHRDCGAFHAEGIEGGIASDFSHSIVTARCRRACGSSSCTRIPRMPTRRCRRWDRACATPFHSSATSGSRPAGSASSPAAASTACARSRGRAGAAKITR